MSNCERCGGTGWIHGLGALGVGSMECTVCTTVRKLAVVTLATGEVLHVPIKDGPGPHIRASEELREIPNSYVRVWADVGAPAPCTCCYHHGRGLPRRIVVNTNLIETITETSEIISREAAA